MNKPEPRSDIEASVRRLFQPDAAAVARVLARVHRAPSRRRRPSGPWTWAVAVLLTLLLATTLVWRERQPAPSRVDDSPLSITGDRELVVVERTVDGRRWAVIPAGDGARVGNYVIVMER